MNYILKSLSEHPSGTTVTAVDEMLLLFIISLEA